MNGKKNYTVPESLIVNKDMAKSSLLLQQRATRLGFFIAGFAIAAWAPLVPYAKARANLSEDTLGLLLLCLGIGSIIAMPVGSACAVRFGCRRVFFISTLLLCLALPPLAAVSGFAGLALALFVFGAGLGSLDCVMNMQAIVVERLNDRPLMSGFHAQFSLGGIAGALGVSAILSIGVSPVVALFGVVALIVAVMAVAMPHMLVKVHEGTGKLFAFPHGIVVLFGAICFASFLAEGAILDWSAVFLTEVQEMQTSMAGLGYAAFAAAMTTGRLTGDALVHKFRYRAMLAAGAACAATGLTVASLSSWWLMALFGYALVGFGCANIVPIMYSLVGRQNVMSQSAAVAAITTMGYAGMLVGPALIGFVAELAGLPVSFMIVALMLFAVSIVAIVLKRFFYH